MAFDPNCASWAQLGIYQLSELHELTLKSVHQIGYKHFAEFWEAAGVPKASAVALAGHDVQQVLVHERISSILLAFGMFEGGLTRLAVEVLKNSDLGLSINDFAGNGIHRMKVVLTKVGGVRFAFSSPDWELLTKVASLRNIVLHGGGVVDPSNSKHNDMLQQDGVSSVRLSDDGTMIFSISDDYLSRAYISFRALLISLTSEVQGMAKC